MAPVKYEKCAHPACSCTTTSGQFCSAECEGMKQALDAHCPCKHPGCKDSKHSIASSAFEIQSRINQRKKMKRLSYSFAAIALLAIGWLAGCSGTATKSPDVSDSIRKSLDQAGFKDVSVSQDLDKGIVTLGGHVQSEGDKSQAESLAKALAGAQVVADQIAVLPVGAEKAAKAINSDLDEGIEKNLDAALIQNKMHDDVKYEVKSGVVTLSGEVHSQSRRDQAQKVAMTVPNVTQVVNDLQVKDQKASSSM
jgi:osmotically-inducible protein OsmY